MNEEQKHQMPPQNASRARKEKNPMLSASLAKVVKKAAQIADLMSGEDVEADLKVLRDAKKATHHVYDTKKKKLVKAPDHKTRLAATTLSRAYHEGKPVERSISLQGDADDFATMLEKARNSPAALESLQNTVLGNETVSTLKESQIGEQQ